MSSIDTTKNNVSTLPSSPKAQTAKEVIAGNVKLLIEQLEIPQIAASIAGHRRTDHQRFLIRHALRHLQFLEEEVDALNQEISRRMEDPALGEAFLLLQSPWHQGRIGGQHPCRSGRRHAAVPNRSSTQLLGRSVSCQS